MHIGRITLGIAAATAALALAALGVDRGWVHLQDPSRRELPVRGLDVSHHQGRIDWPRVARDGRWRFVWIKATEGGDWVDPSFVENWRGASAAGLDVGAYHFFTLCTPGATQAAHFLATVPPGGALPPALDLEYVGNCARRPSPAEARAEIAAFADAVTAALGRRPIVYTTREFHRTILGSALDDCPLWLRDVFSRPTELGGRRWDFWQYLSRGRVDGIDGYVDQNAFRGDDGDYRRWRDAR